MAFRLRPPEGDFAPPPMGSHPARLYRIVDCGTQESTFNNETKRARKLMLSWELVGTHMPDDEQRRPYTVHATYTNSTHEKASLRKLLESWRGRAFTKEEMEAFDVETLIGKGCYVNIVHKTKGDRVYANIASVMAAPKGQAVPPLVNAPLVFNLDAPDWQVFNSLSETMQNKIKQAPEYVEAKEPRHLPDEEVLPGEPNAEPDGFTDDDWPADSRTGPQEPDDDIPF